MRRLARQTGFTLIELIAVIVVIAVIAISSFQFVGFGTQIYTDAIARDEQVSQGRFILERMTRELENALPASIRTSSDGRCLEYVPIVASSLYTQIPLPGRVDPFEAVTPFSYSFSAGDRIAVFTLTEAHVYGSTARIKRIDADAATPVQLDTPAAGYSTYAIDATDGDSFQRESSARRFHIVQDPISWCLDAEQRLYRYSGYGLLASQPNLTTFAGLPPGSFNQDLMAIELRNDVSLAAQQPFQLIDSDVRRTTLELVLQIGSLRTDEILTMHHGVTIVNLP